MQFNSLTYLGFLAVVAVAFWLASPRVRRVLVPLVSLAFYAMWGAWFVAIPVCTALLVYVVSRRMIGRPESARRWMWGGIVVVVSALAVFKYAGFFVANCNALLTWIHARPMSRVQMLALPLGISFYSFEAIGFLVDVRQGRVKRTRFVDILTFLMFWPNVTAGPIVRARELMPQLAFTQKFEAAFVFEGLDRIVWGLVQKNVIANTLGFWTGPFFAKSGGSPAAVESWGMAIAYGLQIYFDFAAYSNMAIGAAWLIGVRLPENFNHPYYAKSPADFWARWHMSLSRWIRDYLFFPINAKYRGAALPLYASLIGVMALVGLWHGAGWTFVLWGLMHGVYLVLYRVYESATKDQEWAERSHLMPLCWRGFTLVAVVVAWVPFASIDMARTREVIAGLLMAGGRGANLSAPFYVFVALAALICVLEPLIRERLAVIRGGLGKTTTALGRVVMRPAVYVCALLLFAIFDRSTAQFIYFQF